MKILWLANGAVSEVNRYLGKNGGVSWIDGMFETIKPFLGNQIEKIILCFPSSNAVGFETNSITDALGFIQFPESKRKPEVYCKEYETYFEEILKRENPDIIHIFGTEYPHTLSMVKAAHKLNLQNKIVINIQGLTSVIGNHYFANLSGKDIHACTLRDFLKNDNIYQQRKKFLKRGNYEIQAIQKVKNVIGRTDWDKACSLQINPQLNYYFCNETLREPFYSGEWSVEKCERHALFVSQSYYPVKGLHYLLQIMPDLIKKYPDIKIYTTGVSPLCSRLTVRYYRQTYYDRIIAGMIKKFHLEDRIIYLGRLSAEEMKNRFLQSHIFISSSSIENESNSISEAKMLGVPVIASYVGGVTGRIRHGTDGFLYPLDEPYMMRYYIEQIFDTDELADKISRNARQAARILHDKRINGDTILTIYKSIFEQM